MSALDRDLAAELRRRLRLAETTGNAAHLVLAMGYLADALPVSLGEMPATAEVLAELLARFARGLQPEAPNLSAALGFEKRQGQGGHALRRALRQLQDDDLLRAVDAMRELQLSEWSACVRLAVDLKTTAKALAHRVSAARSIPGNDPRLPGMPRPSEHPRHDEASPTSSPRALL